MDHHQFDHKNGNFDKEVINLSEFVGKIYRARIIGIPKQKAGHIRYPLYIEKDPKQGSVKVRIAKEGDKGAKESHTEYRVIREELEHNTCIVEIVLHTGRTHQIRVHMAALGHPLVGDDKYGDKAWNKEHNIHTHQLQSYKLEFLGKTYVSKRKL